MVVDEDPGKIIDMYLGKIHFIVPRFLEKNRMRSESQRMLLIKNNAGAYDFSNKYILLVYNVKIRSILKIYPLIS